MFVSLANVLTQKVLHNPARCRQAPSLNLASGHPFIPGRIKIVGLFSAGIRLSQGTGERLCRFHLVSQPA